VADSLEDVAMKVEAGELLSDADVRALEAGRDIITLGTLAESVRRKLHGPVVTYVRVFDLSLPRTGWPEGVPATAGEVRLMPTPGTLDEAIAAVSGARELADSITVSAFCLSELAKLSEGLPVVLAELKRAGLERIAHAPLDRLRSPERALEAVTDAGLELARLTIDEVPAREWTDVCREVSAHQRRLQSIRVFAPLPRKLDDTQPTTGYADLRRVAIARVLVQNVSSIQVDWSLYGPKLAQVALTFGADDIDSVSALDDESKGHRRSPIEEIRRNIDAAFLTPMERDGRFRPV